MAEPELSPQVFAILSALVEERSGLHYDLTDLDLFAHKVAPVAADAGFPSLLDYYYHLRYDDPTGQATDALVESLLVGETYFFREAAPLHVTIDRLVAPAVRDGRHPRVWSAACGTGEEPLTFAMLLAARGLLDKVDLVASDLNRRSLERARAGRFGRRAVRTEPLPPEARPWLTPSPTGWTVAPELVAAIDWRRVNLVDPAAIDAVAREGAFDLILCRNVLIYFRDDVVRETVEHLAGALAPGGALLVGVSESLLRFGTRLECEELDRCFLYRRQG